MIFGELNVFPLYVYTKTRMISYWTRLIENMNSEANNKLNSKMY